MTTGGTNTFQFSGGNVVEGCQGDGFSTSLPKSPLAATFTENDKDVIRERHFGWEKASFSLLGAIFGVHPNTIAAICRQPLHNPSDNSSNASRGGEGVEPVSSKTTHKPELHDV